MALDASHWPRILPAMFCPALKVSDLAKSCSSQVRLKPGVGTVIEENSMTSASVE